MTFNYTCTALRLKVSVFHSYEAELKRPKLLFPLRAFSQRGCNHGFTEAQTQRQEPKVLRNCLASTNLKRNWRAHHETNGIGKTLKLWVFTHCQWKARPIAPETGDHSTSAGDLEPRQPRRCSGQDTARYSITLTWTWPMPRAGNPESMHSLPLKRNSQQMQAGLSFHHYVPTRNWTKVTKHCTFTAMWLLVCGHFQQCHGLSLNQQPQGERLLYLITRSPCLIKFAFIWFSLLVVPTMTS